MSSKQQQGGPSGRGESRRPPNPRHRDNYPHDAKAEKASVCSECGLVLHGGRWTRGAPPTTDVGSRLCPACERVRDRYPAGTISVPSTFLAARDEVLGMIRNTEKAESEEHPLERVMDVEDAAGGGLLVTTTGVHVARAIAAKLERRFHSQARFHYSDGDRTVSVDWAVE